MSRTSVLLALAMVVGAPALAQAQLFPNLPLRNREKPDCAHENPQNRMIRQEYWGHYPTCWRRFPPGWGCPSPEAPNWEQAKRDLKLTDLPPAENGAADDPLPPENNDSRPAPRTNTTPPADNDFPPLPNEGASPFDNTVKPPAARPTPTPGADPASTPPATPTGGTPPADTPPVAAPPGDLPPPPRTPPTTAASRPRRGTLASLWTARRR